MIAKYFVKESPKVDLIQFGGEHSEKLVDELLCYKNDSLSIKISQASQDNLWIRKFNTSSIIFYDSIVTFNLTVKNIPWMNFYTNSQHKHLVYVKNANTSMIRAIIKNKIDIHNVNFLLNESEESIDLVSPHMYSSIESCHKIELLSINQYRKLTMQWDNSIFYPQQYHDLNGCTMKVGYSRLFIKIIERKIYETLSKPLNFATNYVMMEEPLDVRPYDLLSGMIAQPAIADQTIPSSTVLIWHYTFFIPPGDPYTQLEKMFLMFDWEVWIAIVVTLLISVVVIQITNLFSKKIQNFVYGRNIRTPTLNLQAIFLTGAQHKVPGRNFARFLLLLFVIWSLIIRTCYQSELFKYLQNDIRKPYIKTIDELIERNFTFYCAPVDEWLESYKNGRT